MNLDRSLAKLKDSSRVTWLSGIITVGLNSWFRVGWHSASGFCFWLLTKTMWCAYCC